jgi:predicted transcriptional regulator
MVASGTSSIWIAMKSPEAGRAFGPRDDQRESLWDDESNQSFQVSKHIAVAKQLRQNCIAIAMQRCPMKTATIPSLRVAPALRQAVEEVLSEGESLSNFVEQSIRDSIERRQAQREFVARGLVSRDKAKQSGKYVSSSAVIDRLEKMLVKAKVSSKARG